MKVFNKKIAVILYGAPGSGKGTQAKLLADKLGLFHFDTGDFLRKLVYDPKLQKNAIIKRERRLNDSGKLQTPSFVLKVVSQKVRELIKLGQGIIFSGSPRTLFEAFGTPQTKGLLSTLEGGYKKNNIFIFVLDIPERESIKRNKRRAVCVVCKTPLLSAVHGFKDCPFCGAKIAHRLDDNEEVISIRLKEYRERTKPIFDRLKKGKYRMYKIDGMPAPYKIHQKMISFIK